MVRNLLGDIVRAGTVRVVIAAAEELSQDGIVRLLDALGFDVPAREVVPQNRDEALFGRGEVAGAVEFIMYV